MLYFLIPLVFILACQREYTNPWDEKANLDPEAWAPKNLQIEDISITEKKLTWEYGDENIEGFKLDRKKGDEAWRVAYQTFSKETRTWKDTDIIPELSLNYEYRLYAFAGNYGSAVKTESSSVEFPAPTNLQTEKLSDKSYKLTWTDNSTGEQGFKIDRSVDSSNWQVGYGIVQSNKTEFIDTNVFAKAVNVNYRVYAFYEEFESNKILTNTNAELTAPTNLHITKNSITSVTLYWLYNSTNEDGFKIERKYEGGDWAEIATVTGINFEDNNFNLNTQVYYRVCAYIGSHNSSWADNDFDATIPPPENLDLTVNSGSSLTLIWDYSSNGHEGFKIDRKINEGTWVEGFVSLNPGQTSFEDDDINLQTNDYYYRVYVYYQNYNSTKINTSVDFVCGYSLFGDPRDGNEYETVQIGDQCWMKENLAYLPSVDDPDNGSQTSPYYYVYGYEGTNVAEAKATDNYQNYGVLYNWPAALNACPEGWSLPSDDEWIQLSDFLGGESVAGGKMKSTRTEPDPHPRWDSPNTGATNESGWSGLPAGYRFDDGGFSNVGYSGSWWSSSEFSSADAWKRLLGYNYENVTRNYYSKGYGFSVRCLRD